MSNANDANWSLWADIPQVEVWQAVALSLNIEPDRVPGLNFRPIIGGPFDDCPGEFQRRIKIACAHIDSDSLVSTSGAHSLHFFKVKLGDFAHWAVSVVRWTKLPSALTELAQVVAVQTHFYSIQHAGRDDERVTEITDVSHHTRQQYNELQAVQAARQAKGRYTVEDAVKIIADATGERPMPLLLKLAHAIGGARLNYYRPGENQSAAPDEVTPYYHEVYGDEVNAWLDSDIEVRRIPFRLPTPGTSKAQSDATQAEAVINPKGAAAPRNAIGKLAIEAASEIKQKTKRAASVKDVMKLLKKWAEDGTKPDTLLRYDSGKRAVIWRTTKGEKPFDEEACSKCLARWATPK